MNSINTIHRCFTKPNFHRISLVLTLVGIQYFPRAADAVPVIYSDAHFTDRYATHSIPGLPIGDYLQTGVAVDSSDPVGSLTISVEAMQGESTLALEFVSSSVQIYPGLHLYAKIYAFDPGLLGPWEITATDSTGKGPSIFTSAIAEPEFVPYLENVTVAGTSTSATVNWDLPNLDGFDVDRVYVLAVEAASGNHVYISNVLPVAQTSYHVPAGILTQGVDYAFRIILADVEDGFNENRSNTFSDPFRLTVTGDYSQDGIVDAADYTVWRDNVGGTSLLNRGPGITGLIGDADYKTWKDNFGAALGAGSVSLVGTGAQSPAVPEPSAMALATWALGVLGMFAARREERQL